jgi:cellulose synthase/poly-beta-1,6-N-acetylglucosamine synthase-like glycosyltransferase
MLPDGLYKRRRNHNNTPPSVLLVFTNCIVLAVLIQMFTGCSTINNFFWIALGVLALYNVYTIRQNREAYNRLNIIIYIVSILLMVLLFFYFNNQPHKC